MTVDLRHGNCLDVLPTLPDCSVDSIVTDPPYELGFMGKKWDNSGIAYNIILWQECLRVLKPGGHLLAFGGTRTYHRMACAIEDAGFEIRDSIHWLYGSGFPKSLDVSKAIDKRGGLIPWQKEFAEHLKQVKPKSITTEQINNHVALNGSKSNFWGHFTDTKSQPLLPTVEQYLRLREIVPISQEWDDQFLPEAEREIIGNGWRVDKKTSVIAYGGGTPEGHYDITAPATEQAKQWAGWGTALKPAHEPIVVARKPLVGTVASNVLEHGTGAINIDASRIAGDMSTGTWNGLTKKVGYEGGWDSMSKPNLEPHLAGRWPANVILGHTEDCDDECVPGCPVALLDEQSGISKDGVAGARTGTVNGYEGGWGAQLLHKNGYGGAGGASRFFYCAKPSRRERNAGLDHLKERPVAGASGNAYMGVDSAGERKMTTQNHHPTVKPIALMRYLVRLVTPPGGTVLEPFAGSGTTLMACVLENFHAIGIEMTDEYLPIIEGRVAWAEEEASKESPQQELEL